MFDVLYESIEKAPKRKESFEGMLQKKIREERTYSTSAVSTAAVSTSSIPDSLFSKKS